MDVNQPTLLVVIPAYNEEEHIAQILTFCMEETKHYDAIIAVADGNSSDNTRSIIQFIQAEQPNIRLIDNEKKIQSAGINQCVAQFGKGRDFIIRMDVHAEYPMGYIDNLVQEAIDKKADSVVVSMDTQGTTPTQSMIALAQNSALGNGGSGHRNNVSDGKWVDHGHHALMRTSAFQSVGGYDETFSHNEDAELDYRLTEHGYKIWLTGKTQLIYFPRKTLRSLFSQYRNYGKGRAKNMLKHGSKPSLRQLIPAAIFPAVALAILTSLHWIFLVPTIVWAASTLVAGIFIGTKLTTPLKFRKYAIGVPAMTMHLAWSYGYCCQLMKRPSSPSAPIEIKATDTQ